MIVASAKTLRRQIELVLSAWGMRKDYVEQTAEVMVDTDLRGIESHGIGMLPGYARMVRSGRMDLNGEVRVVTDLPSIGRVDGGHNLGHPVSIRAMSLAIDKCRATGVGVVSAYHSGHHGACGYYARMASRDGLVGVAMTGTPSGPMVPTLGREPVLGTNPIAFSAPARRNPAFVLDMATSTASLGKLSIARRRGAPLPEGWALDGEGRPTTDAEVASVARRLTPLGGTRELGSHKGYGLAAMVDVLSNVLSGAAVPAVRSSDKSDVGHFFMALDPELFCGRDAFLDDMDALIDALHHTRPADESEPVLVAGDPENAAYETRSREGIPVSEGLAEEVRAVVAAAGVEFLLEGSET